MKRLYHKFCFGSLDEIVSSSVSLYVKHGSLDFLLIRYVDSEADS